MLRGRTCGIVARGLSDTRGDQENQAGKPLGASGNAPQHGTFGGDLLKYFLTNCTYSLLTVAVKRGFERGLIDVNQQYIRRL